MNGFVLVGWKVGDGVEILGVVGGQGGKGSKRALSREDKAGSRNEPLLRRRGDAKG